MKIWVSFNVGDRVNKNGIEYDVNSVSIYDGVVDITLKSVNLFEESDFVPTYETISINAETTPTLTANNTLKEVAAMLGAK